MKTFFVFTLSLIFLNLLKPELKHSLAPELKENGDLIVTVTNMENDKGQVRAVLFNGEEGFPDESEKAFRSISVPAESSKTTFAFENVPYGEYALSLLHDENENGKMDTNLFGYPQEGYGVSNNITNMLGMPTYEKARFLHDESRETILIHLLN